ncbi:MAG TPA: hypothetical protein VK348_05675 [Planctomycetota bacterium]|nr:hypothetical protein [Planctomycetota bacterium]
MQKTIVSAVAIMAAIACLSAWMPKPPVPVVDLLGKTVAELLRAHGAPTAISAMASGGLELEYTQGQQHAKVVCHHDIVVQVVGVAALPVAAIKLPPLYLGMPVAEAMPVLGNPSSVVHSVGTDEIVFADGRHVLLANGRLMQVPAAK